MNPFKLVSNLYINLPLFLPSAPYSLFLLHFSLRPSPLSAPHCSKSSPEFPVICRGEFIVPQLGMRNARAAERWKTRAAPDDGENATGNATSEREQPLISSYSFFHLHVIILTVMYRPSTYLRNLIFYKHSNENISSPPARPPAISPLFTRGNFPLLYT